VGINRRTGTRWRYGRTILNTAGEPVHYPAVSLVAAKPRHPRYLSLAERTTIADLRRAGVSVRDIADELGRAASTVSRELRRNGDDRGRYLPATAERLSAERQCRSSRTRRLTRDVQLYGVVAELLGKRWSPEQVAHELMGAGNRSAIGTLVERTTRLVILIHVPTGQPTAEAIRDGITDALGAFAPHLRRTLTWDQGKELALHQQITSRVGTRVFFCDAHAPWQRASNEKTRIRTACCEITFPKALTWPTSHPRNCNESPTNSMTGPVKLLAGPDPLT
jgi:IS30 family transposase